MDEIVQEFLVESSENLDQLDRDLVALEREPDSRDLLSSIFRTIHTIKGTSGFLAFTRLEKVTHIGENLLSRLRDGEFRMTPETTDVLLKMVDSVRALLVNIEENGVEGEVDVDSVVAAITVVMENQKAGVEPTPEAAPVTVVAEAPAEPAPAAKKKAKKAAAAPIAAAPDVVAPDVAASEVAAPDVAPALQAAVDEVAAAAAPPAPAPAPPAPAPAPAPTKSAPAPAAKDGEQPVRRSAADSTIRVDVDLLDSLMRLVGELVLTRNQIVQIASAQHDATLLRSTQRLNLIASELQEGVMKTRMQPVDHLWAKLPRVVRDLSHMVDKKIDLVMEGKETELDRTLLEAIKDPLTHIVRNSVDHGIENNERRAASGKNMTGTLTLRAFHQSGQVIIEISDDGGGIDPARVGAKALERNLVSREQLDRMSDRDITDLVFRPGFSTAEAVSNISGRGVGMDVVRTNIENIGGSVELDSVLGQGTTTRLSIPLTLAIVPALTVECGGERYAIPQISLLELVFLDDSDGSDKAGVEFVSGTPVYRLRGNLLPLVYLDELLGLPPQERGGIAYIAVLQSEDRRFGLVVDRVLNTEEIVVKSLSARLKGIGLYAGATILGDGRVALILDVQALARRSHVEAAERLVANEARATAAAGPAGDLEQLLVVGAAGRRLAIPLEMVTRLEIFTGEALERSGGREVAQYRGQIVPIVRLSQMLGAYDDGEVTAWPVVVYSEGGRTVALVVDQILDIVEEVVHVRSDIEDSGVMGSAVIQDRVTELLDVRQALLSADPRFYSAEYGEADADQSWSVYSA